MTSMSLAKSLARMSREEYQRWVERVSRGFERGETVELSLKHIRGIMMGSKGNIAVATPRHLFILVNLSYAEYQRLVDIVSSKYEGSLADARIVCRIVKSVPERKFSLAEAVEFRLVYRYVRGYTDYVVEREGERCEVEGAELVITEGVRRGWQERGEAVIQWDGRGFRLNIDSRERVKLYEEREQSIVWRVIDPGRPLGSFLAKNQELLKTRPSSVHSDILLFTDKLVVKAAARPSGIKIETYNVELPSEEELLECSRFYSIVIPRMYIMSYNGARVMRVLRLDVYYKGVKKTVTLNYIPSNLLFRCLRMRYSISSYAKKVLPKGKEYLSIDLDLFCSKHADWIKEWTRMIREEILPKVRSLRSKPRKLDPVDAFCELWYVRMPRRKIENVVKPWIEIYEKVKDLAPKTALYIIFYGQRDSWGRKHQPKFIGFRVDRDGFVSPMPSRYVPVSGIAMKGGDFERLYREAYVRKLFEYQIVPRSEKLRILAEDVEEIRAMLRGSGTEPSTAKFEEVKTKLLAAAMDYDGDNIVLLAIKHFNNMKEYISRTRTQISPEDLLKMIVGLVKTGKYPEDFQRFAELGGLKYLRMVVKYEMKRRGYSIKKGVLFLGNPGDVKRRILEVVKGLRGRLLALVEEFGEAEVAMPFAEKLRRVEALLGF